uniref:mRNA decay activator protein ZFP36 n=1 Tax=Oryzias sinensis TaxID=183150 RepID=A0A8C7ZJL1_9TELE
FFITVSTDSPRAPSCQDEGLLEGLLDSDGSCRGGGLSLAEALLPLVSSASPSSPSPVICSTRYKTELCSSYSSSGLCRYADRCQFAHGLQELHAPFHHPKYKTELCRSFHATGHCFYGSRCLFVHSPAEQRRAPRRRRNVPCRTFRAFRVCPFGSRCNFLHVGDAESGDLPEEKSPRGGRLTDVRQQRAPAWRPRGALCRSFSAFGFCLYGTRCRFQHGLPSMIQTSGSESPRSSSISSSPSPPPLDTPSSEPPHNAFTFSSQHLSDLMVPLALHLQQLESYVHTAGPFTFPIKCDLLCD